MSLQIILPQMGGVKNKHALVLLNTFNRNKEIWNCKMAINGEKLTKYAFIKIQGLYKYYQN